MTRTSLFIIMAAMLFACGGGCAFTSWDGVLPVCDSGSSDGPDVCDIDEDCGPFGFCDAAGLCGDDTVVDTGDEPDDFIVAD